MPTCRVLEFLAAASTLDVATQLAWVVGHKRPARGEPQRGGLGSIGGKRGTPMARVQHGAQPSARREGTPLQPLRNKQRALALRAAHDLFVFFVSANKEYSGRSHRWVVVAMATESDVARFRCSPLLAPPPRGPLTKRQVL